MYHFDRRRRRRPDTLSHLRHGTGHMCTYKHPYEVSIGYWHIACLHDACRADQLQVRRRMCKNLEWKPSPTCRAGVPERMMGAGGARHRSWLPQHNHDSAHAQRDAATITRSLC